MRGAAGIGRRGGSEQGEGQEDQLADPRPLSVSPRTDLITRLSRLRQPSASLSLHVPRIASGRPTLVPHGCALPLVSCVSELIWRAAFDAGLGHRCCRPDPSTASTARPGAGQSWAVVGEPRVEGRQVDRCSRNTVRARRRRSRPDQCEASAWVRLVISQTASMSAWDPTACLHVSWRVRPAGVPVRVSLGAVAVVVVERRPGELKLG